MKKTTIITPLLTPWGQDNLNQECPLGEYPRPQLRRKEWQCLNGAWDYAINSGERPTAFDGRIRVPYSPETILSGVKRKLKIGETLWYRRVISIKRPERGGRVLLNFGAVDQCCSVWLNDQKLGEHQGGYFPFFFDLSDVMAEGENALLIAVTDRSERGDEAYGKQTTKRGGIWYTGQSGIWQTVWLETVPENYVTSLQITPDVQNARVKIKVNCSGSSLSGEAAVSACGKVIAKADLNGGSTVIPLPGFSSWSPESPFLYDLTITAGEDHLTSYFGMRSFGFARGKHGRKILTLNGKPIFHHGLLDQGYWSDGLYTPPSDEAMIWEISKMKEMGFNMLRKHIKIEPLRWYYHCDRLGMLVWQDFVSGGGPYSDMMVRYLPWVGVNLKDSHYALFGRASEGGRENYLRDAKRTVELLYNSVGLCCWVPFNEGWGQFDAQKVAKLIKEMDQTRYIDHASGYHDQGGGDFQSSHIYYKRYALHGDRFDRVRALTEFGGYSLPTSGHMGSDALFGYKLYQSKEHLSQAVWALYESDVLPAIRKGLGVDIYTQVSDVEDEINGLITFDRKVIKLPPDEMNKLAEKIKREFERYCYEAAD